MRRRLLTLIVCALTVAVAATAATVPRVVLPRDHFGHRAGIEWWYVTGVLQGSDGMRYSVFFTLFKRAGFVVPVSQVVNLDTGAVVGHTETVGRATIGGTALNVTLPGAALRYAAGRWSFSASAAGYALELSASPRKPYVLHGATGYIRQSTAGLSAYYSNTRMAAVGSVTTSTGVVRLSGQAWLDHQWGNFASDPAALNWDWFSCRFDDRTELMLYRFRAPDGTPLARYGSGTFIRSNGTAVATPRFSVTPGQRVFEGAGRRWPLDWQLSLPAQNLELRLVSTVSDQLVRGTVLPTFYEGVADATGSKTGTCFVEQSYAG